MMAKSDTPRGIPSFLHSAMTRRGSLRWKGGSTSGLGFSGRSSSSCYGSVISIAVLLSSHIFKDSQRLDNLERMRRAGGAGLFVGKMKAADIADGHREKTFLLLRGLLGK